MICEPEIPRMAVGVVVERVRGHVGRWRVTEEMRRVKGGVVVDLYRVESETFATARGLVVDGRARPVCVIMDESTVTDRLTEKGYL